MNNLINKILKEAEDSSDDFFQSKHVNKRKKDFRKKEMIKNNRLIRDANKLIDKLEKGLNVIKIAYDNKKWSSRAEENFLQEFHSLIVNHHIYRHDYFLDVYVIYLMRPSYYKECYFEIDYHAITLEYDSIYQAINLDVDFSDRELKNFIQRMIKKYFSMSILEVRWDYNVSSNFKRYNTSTEDIL